MISGILHDLDSGRTEDRLCHGHGIRLDRLELDRYHSLWCMVDQGSGTVRTVRPLVQPPE